MQLGYCVRLAFKQARVSPKLKQNPFFSCPPPAPAPAPPQPKLVVRRRLTGSISTPPFLPLKPDFRFFWSFPCCHVQWTRLVLICLKHLTPLTLPSLKSTFSLACTTSLSLVPSYFSSSSCSVLTFEWQSFTGSDLHPLLFPFPIPHLQLQPPPES